MTENPLTVPDMQFEVSYTPSTIKIENEELLESLIEQTTEHYSNQVFKFDAENVAEAKQAKIDLNKIAKMIDDRRKEIKADYSQPLNTFEEKMKRYVERIKKVSDDINSGIKLFDESEKAIRIEKIKIEMEKIAEPLNIEPEAIEISTSWINKTAFTTKGEVKGKILDEIHDKMKIVAMQKSQIAADKATITDYAEIAGLDPYAWSGLIDQGWSVADIREKIKQAVEDKRRREQAEKEAEAERQRKKAEYDAAIAEMEREKAVETNQGTLVDPETGELIQAANNEPSVPITEVDDNPTMTVTLQLTASRQKLANLNEYLVENGISVVPVQ
ncbi:DUF1351 domain-containing protein [Enterococcus dispar]|uniref:DUF1351 domain-containing protein n=1 Tax=Enterococcus dispar ATCC 51266 TaxID=1139219 RepID=S1NXF1_9ENTE|nr:DUF1351 domain-containing protein [Enterococcus dispar]EOT43779.1 hypothetical protein OMK_00337 [Enterococcus dispar ATCC 51266]EOW85549.1 hypothetical protein I569_00862 [Enterococcus dispar ATCC 51266]